MNGRFRGPSRQDRLIQPSLYFRLSRQGGLEQYLALTNDELQAFPASLHEWFLERWALAGPGTDDSERVLQLADRIATMYLIAGPGTHQAAAVAALLAFDRQWEQELSYVTRIWDVVTESVPAEAQANALVPLIEALLDLVYLTVDNGAVLRALREIAQRDAQTRYALPLMRERVEMVREEHEGPAARLLSEFFR